jgi:hypothetical protein
MAVNVDSFTKKLDGAHRAFRYGIVQIDLDNEYPQTEGGYEIPLAGVSGADGYTIIHAVAQPNAAYRFWFDAYAQRLKAYVVSTDAVTEVANDFDLSGVTNLQLSVVLA